MRVQNTRVQNKIVFRCVPSCARWECICSLLNNLAQQDVDAPRDDTITPYTFTEHLKIFKGGIIRGHPFITIPAP